MVMTVAKAAAEGSAYYQDPGYYQDGGHAHAEWLGAGAETLGLTGEFGEHDFETFDRLLKGELPNGEKLQGPPDGGPRRTGADFTFSPPKSVSVMALIHNMPEVKQAVLDSSKEAMLQLIQERDGIIQARGMENGEQVRVPGDPVVAVFLHETARPVNGVVDPQLHLHCVVTNVAIRESDGKPVAIDVKLTKDDIIRHGQIANSILANKLRSQGAQIVATKDAFEIAGVSKAYTDEFSGRSGQIVAELEKEGLTRASASTQQKQAANLQTREAKSAAEKSGIELNADWIDRSKKGGFHEQGEIVKAEMRERAAHLTPETHDQRMDMAAAALLSAARHLSERQSIFEAKEVMTLALKAGIKNGIMESEIRQAWIEKKDRHGLLTAKAPIDPKTGAISTERWVTTRLAVARDEKMIKNLRAGKGAIPLKDRWTKEEVDKAIAAFETQKGFQLSPDQVVAAHLTLETADRTTCWQGHAGAGKTTTLEIVKIVAEARGYEVVGIAPTKQAVEMMDEANVKSMSAAEFLARGAELNAGTLVILDEAGMIASAQGAQIVQAVEHHKARAVWIGDDNQYQSIGAGSAFRLTKQHSETAILSDIRRQKDNPELLNVVKLFANEQFAPAAQAMTKYMVEVNAEGLEGREQINQAIANDSVKYYLSLPSGAPERRISEQDKEVESQVRDNTIIVVATHNMREKVNFSVRAGMKEEGIVAQIDTHTRTLHALKDTKEQLRQAHYYDDKMKDEDGKAVQIVIIPSFEIKGNGYATHGVKYADEAIQKHHLEVRAEMSKQQGEEAKKNMPVILEKGLEYRVQSVDLQKAEVRLIDKENREIIWKPEEAGKVKAYEEHISEFAQGDRVLFKENQKIQQPDGTEASVTNGHRGTVQKIEGDSIYIKTAKGEDVVIDKNGGVRVEHAYSGTGHSFQGASVGYDIGAFKGGSPINNANQGYVFVSRAKLGTKVFTDDVQKLQKDWEKAEYQLNAIDFAHSKDQQKFNQQVEEKKMEIVEKEDMEPEKGPASVSNEREAPDAPREAEPANREAEKAQPAAERDTHETAPVEKEVTAQPAELTEYEKEGLAMVEAYRLDAEERQARQHMAELNEQVNSPDNPHNWYDDHGRSVASQEEIQKWEAEHPEAAERYHRTPDQQAPEAEKDGAERATVSAMEPAWDESAPAPTSEQDYAESAPEPEHRQGQSQGMQDATLGHHHEEKPFVPYISPELREKLIEEQHQRSLEDEAYRNPTLLDIGIMEHEQRMIIEERAREAMRVEGIKDPDAISPSAGGAPSKDKDVSAEPVQQQPENQRPPMPPMDRLEKWAETQRPERGDDAGKDAQNWDTVLGREAAQKLRYDPTQQNQQQDKGMEREI